MVDNIRCFQFLIEIDGVTVGAFQECSSLNANMDVIEYREGSENNSVIQLPGTHKFTSITLKRGMAQNIGLLNWYRVNIEGSMVRKMGIITLLDETGDSISRWRFINGLPTKLEGPSLNTAGNEVAIETLEIACEGLELITQK